jgi:hypothetical protein
MHAATIIRLDWVALLAGLVVAIMLLLGWRVEGGARVPAAKVALATASTGELDVTPPGVTSRGAAIRAGAGALVRTLTVGNATAGARDVRFGATPEHGDLDHVVHVSVVADGRRLFAGTLARFRRGSSALRLERGQRAAVDVRMSIPADTPAHAWRAQSVSVRLDLTSTEAR